MKHAHEKIIKEWLEDTKKKTQRKNSCKEWVDCSGALIADDEDGQFEFRIKPREFTKGHWYPCLDIDYISVKMWTGSIFIDESGDTLGFDLDDFTEIGESLGEIKFGGEG